MVSPPNTARTWGDPVTQWPVHWLPKNLIVLFQSEERIPEIVVGIFKLRGHSRWDLAPSFCPDIHRGKLDKDVLFPWLKQNRHKDSTVIKDPASQTNSHTAKARFSSVSLNVTF